MKNEVIKKEETKEVVLGGDIYGTWGAGGGDDFEQSDVITPRIILLQKMSQLVDDGSGKAGEFLDSIDKMILSDGVNALEIIIIDKNKSWKVSDVNGNKPVYVRMEEFNSETASASYEFEENGIKMRRDKLFNYTCFVVKEKGGLENEMPYLFTLSRSAGQVAKHLNTIIEKLRVMKKPSAATTFLITSTKVTNDKGTWHIPEVKVGRPTTQEEAAVAFSWWESLKTGKVAIKAQDNEADF